ncbi:MAG: hypothetical protein JXD18_02175 [Anaerolineae bacterium]|nr:hypothetical protein [Anaerolineae bacterium]
MTSFPLSYPPVDRLRRNHALEHATIHVLTQRYRNVSLVGHSTFQGFVLYGDLPTEAVFAAAQHAMDQLRSGRYELAIHADCGTNLATSGILAGLGAFAVLTPRRRGWQEWLNRLPLVILVSTLGVLAGKRVGTLLQAQVTTNPHVGTARVAGVVREERGQLIVHRVKIADS